MARVDGKLSRIVDLKRENHQPYTLHLTCSPEQDGQDLPVQLYGSIRGDVVVTASLAGLIGVPIDPVYAATKHAVVGLVRSLGPVHRSEGIRVNAVHPGFVETSMTADAPPAFREASIAGTPLGRVGRDDEVAARASGINTTRYKLAVFGISAFTAGLSGGLYAHFMRGAGPSTLATALSFQVVIWGIFGGVATVYGPVVAVFLDPASIRTEEGARNSVVAVHRCAEPGCGLGG